MFTVALKAHLLADKKQTPLRNSRANQEFAKKLKNNSQWFCWLTQRSASFWFLAFCILSRQTFPFFSVSTTVWRCECGNWKKLNSSKIHFSAQFAPPQSSLQFQSSTEDSHATAHSGPFYFDQKLDHFNAFDGRTFAQRFFANSAYYEPNGPVFRMTLCYDNFISVYIGGESELTENRVLRGEVETLARLNCTFCLIIIS